MTEKKRLDVLLVDLGLAESREKAKAVIMAGSARSGNALCQPGRLKTGESHADLWP